MNNEECLSLQNIPASLPLPRARSSCSKLGHAGPPELGQWGEREGGGMKGNTEGDLERNPSSSFEGLHNSVCKGIEHVVQIFAFL